MICDYFDITPLDFFDAINDEVIILKELNNTVSDMDKEDISLLIKMANRIKQ